MHASLLGVSCKVAQLVANEPKVLRNIVVRRFVILWQQTACDSENAAEEGASSLADRASFQGEKRQI